MNPDERLESVGQAVPNPVQFSATSQGPPDARHSVEAVA